MKIDDKIALAEEKLIEQRTRFEDRKKELDGLIKERARLGASAILDNQKDGKRIAEIDRQRDKLRSQLEIYPDLIKEMEVKIGALKKEKEGGILRENLIKQKKAAREIERLSEDLGTLLGKANDVNVELHKYRSIYLELHKLTNQNVFTKPTTGGSYGWLKVVTGVVKSELEGKPRPGPRYMGAEPPI